MRACGHDMSARSGRGPEGREGVGSGNPSWSPLNPNHTTNSILQVLPVCPGQGRYFERAFDVFAWRLAEPVGAPARDRRVPVLAHQRQRVRASAGNRNELVGANVMARCLAFVVSPPKLYAASAPKRKRVLSSRCDGHEVVVRKTFRGRLTVCVPAPAHDASITTQRKRVPVSTSDCDEISSHTLRRRLPKVVCTPAGDAAVPSKSERVVSSTGNTDEVTLHAAAWRLPVHVITPAHDLAFAR